LLILALVFFQLSIEVADDSEIRVLGRHEFVVPSRKVRHFGDQNLRVGAQLFNNFRVGLEKIERK
jgi:hypothetical protein